MPAKIRLLSESTINQIAAGEIIENPASALKELIENSIDAGALKIQIDVRGGGLLFFQVIDDGIGMNRDDAVFCLERHATSKISKFSDLLQLTSMGFRGEALASIAAVSKMEIETAEEGSVGTKVVCHAGKIVKVEPCSRTRGTTIQVSSLFYNVPARKKFQKSAAQATADIVKMVTRVSLAHKEISFTLHANGKEILTTSNRGEKRIEEVLGKEFLKDTKEIFWEKEGYTISGIVGSPLNVRSNRLQEYLLINKRPVVSHLVERAVQSGFGTRIGNREYPVFVIWMELPPESIDVNVHPQKIFVRFCEEEKVHHFVKSAIEQSFAMPIKIELPKTVPVPYFIEAKEEYKPSFVIKEEVLIQKEIEVIGFFEEVAMVKIPAGLPFFPEEKLVFVDMPKLSAKIEFHRVLKRLTIGEESEMQQLLFPEILKFSSDDLELIMKHQELLVRVGIGIRPFGKDSCMIDTLSQLFSLDDVKKVMDLLLREFRKEFTLEGIAKVVTSFGASRMHSKESLKYRVSELLNLEDPFYAPNGKLIISIFDKEKLFG